MLGKQSLVSTQTGKPGSKINDLAPICQTTNSLLAPLCPTSFFTSARPLARVFLITAFIKLPPMSINAYRRCFSRWSWSHRPLARVGFQQREAVCGLLLRRPSAAGYCLSLFPLRLSLPGGLSCLSVTLQRCYSIYPFRRSLFHDSGCRDSNHRSCRLDRPTCTSILRSRVK